MIKKIRLLMVLLLCGCSLLFSACAAKSSFEEDGYEEFLGPLTNISLILTRQVEYGGMSSSYDLSGGNDDGKNCQEFKADGRRVLADLEGPGCVRRIWLTGMPDDHEFFFYFDGEKKARFILTYKELRGEEGGAFAKPICDYASGAGYCYLPITYKKSLRIEAGPIARDRFFYYQVNYEKLPESTKCESLDRDALARASAKLEEVRVEWRRLQERKVPSLDVEPRIVGPGKEADIFALSKAGVIDQLTIELADYEDIDVLKRNLLLRALAIEIYWDDAETPAVRAPFGDFFCNAVRPKSFRSAGLDADRGVFVSRFPMPFQKSCRIVIKNDSSDPVRVKSDVILRKDLAPSDAYFHAEWNQSVNTGKPHAILNALGKGRYVGCYLVSQAWEPSWNIFEGDESIYLDDSVFPSMHGTGLEDYFNGGWYYNFGIFTMPFAGCLERSGIRSTQFRMHFPDVIQFDKNISMTMEFGHGNQSHGYMSSVAWWYSDRKAGGVRSLPRLEMRLVPRDPLESRSIMCEIYERERTGRLDEAKDLCAEYAAKYPRSPWVPVLGLRSLVYDVFSSEDKSALNRIGELARVSKIEAVRSQASMLEQTLNNNEGVGVLVAHVNSACRIYIDGREVLQALRPDPRMTEQVIVKVGHGKIMLAVEAKAIMRDPWMSLGLMVGKDVFRTDATWKVSTTRPSGWPQPDLSSMDPVVLGGPFPLMSHFQFEPNAFILTQAFKQLVNPKDGWTRGQTVYFASEIEIPEAGE